MRRVPGHEKALQQSGRARVPTLTRGRSGARYPLRPVSCWSGLRIRAARRSWYIAVLIYRAVIYALDRDADQGVPRVPQDMSASLSVAAQDAGSDQDRYYVRTMNAFAHVLLLRLPVVMTGEEGGLG